MRYIFYYFLFAFLGLFYGGFSSRLCAQSVIINEWSQGKMQDVIVFGTRVRMDACVGSGEWVELLVTASSVDLRGWYVTRGGDNLKLFQFSSHADWSAVKEGTIILIYNGEDGLDNISCKESFPLGGSCGVMVFSSKNPDYLNQSQTKWGWELRGLFPRFNILENSMVNNQNHYPKLFNASGAVVHDWSQNNNPAFLAKKPSCTRSEQYCGIRFLGGSVAEVSDPSKWELVSGGYTSYRCKMTPGAPNKDVCANANNANEEWIAGMQDFPQLPQGVEIAVCQGASFSMKFGPFKNKNGEEFLFRFKRPGGSFALARPEVNLNIPSMQATDEGAYEITTCKPNAACSGCNKRDGSIILKMALPPPDPIELTGQWVACERGKINIEPRDPQSSPIDPSAEFQWKGPGGFESFARSISFEEDQATLDKTGSYTLSVTVPACSATALGKAHVIINKQPNIAEIEGPEEVCEGQTLRLSIPPVDGVGVEYKWQGPAGFSATATPGVSLPNITSSQAGVYSLNVVIPGCTALTLKKQIKVVGAPTTLNISSNSPICAGKELVLQCAPPIASLEDNDYLWLAPDNAEVGRGNPLILRGAVAEGAYRLKISKGACLNIDKPIDVQIRPIPSIMNFMAIKDPFCEGEPIRFRYELNFDPSELDFEWKGPGGFSSTLQDPAPIAAPGASGQYNLTVKDKNCNIASNANENVNVVARPNLAGISPASQTVCQGENVALRVEALPGVEYNWRGPGGFRGSENQITLSNIQAAQGGEYSLEAKIAGCPPLELKAKVEVLPTAPAPVLPQSVYRACGSSAFTLQPTNLNPEYEITLYDTPTRSGNPIAKGVMPAGVVTPPLTTTQTYYLEAQLKNSRCPSPLQRVVLEILAELPPPARVDTIICEPGAVTFTVEPAPAPGFVVRLWNSHTGGAQISSDDSEPYTFTTPSVTVNAAFYLDVFDPRSGCFSTRSPVSVTVFERPAAPEAQNQERCGAGSFIFTFPASPTLEYAVYAAAVGQTPLPGLRGNIFQTEVLNEGARQFYVEAVQFGCTSVTRALLTAKVNPIPAPPDVPPTLSRCGVGALTLTYANALGNEIILYRAQAGAEILKQGNAPFWEYGISFSAAGQSHTYFIAQKDLQTGCESERKAVTFKALSEIAFSLREEIIERCGPGSVVIEATPEGASRYRVRLMERAGGTELLRLESPPYRFERDVTASASFWVEVMDLDNNCSGGKKVDIVVNPVPAPPVVPMQIPECGGARFVFDVANPENCPSLAFYDAAQGGAPIATFSGSPFLVQTPLFRETVTWYAELQSAEGCKSQRVPVKFEVNPLPDSPIANRLSRCGQGSFTLTATNFTPGQELRLYSTLGGNPSQRSPSPTLSAFATATTQYYLTYFDITTGCESDPIAWQITVLPELKIDAVREVSGLICGQGAAELEVDLFAPGRFDVILEDNRGNRLAGSPSVSSPYSLRTPELRVETTFRIRVSSAEGCAAESPYTVSVFPLPPKPQTPNIPSVCGGGNVAFTLEPGSSATRRIGLFDSPLAGVTPLQHSSAPFAFTVEGVFQPTTYYARAEDENGCYSEPTPVAIAVTPPPVAPIVRSLYLCAASEAIFTVQNFITYPAGVKIRVFSQQSGGEPVGEANPNFSVPVNAAAAFYFAAYDPAARCESEKTKAEVRVFEPVAFDIKRSPSGALCGAGAVELEVAISRQGRFGVALSPEQSGTPILTETGRAPYRLVAPRISATSTFWVTVADLDFGAGDCKTIKSIEIPVAPLPPAPLVRDLPLQCRAGSVEVSAELPGAHPGAVLRLYREASLVNGSIPAPYTFQTPFLTTTASFLLESFDPVTGCSGGKTPFTAAFRESIPAPQVQDIVLCAPGSARFEIPQRPGLEIWALERPEDANPIKVENGSFIVEVTQAPVLRYFRYQDANGCQSLSTEATASVAAAPIITVAPFAPICGQGKQEIEVELDIAGNYRVALLSASSVVLATSNLRPYRLLTPELSESQDFRIEVTDLTWGCVAEKPFRVEVTQKPPIPTLASAPAAICGPGVAHFTALLSGGSLEKEIRLYTTPFGGRPLEIQTEEPYAFSARIGTSVTYYLASALALNGCESAARLPVSLQVAPVPAPPSVGAVTLCQPGIAVFTPIGVAPLGDKIRVYDAPQNGNLVAERELNQTVSLPVSLATEIFYFEAYASGGGCKSELTAAIARVLPPLTLIYDNQALQRCGAGAFHFSVLLNGASQGIIELYDEAQTPALLLSGIEGSSGSFTTPSVSVTTSWLLKGKDKTTGCQVTQPIEGKVEPPPAPPAVPGFVEYCGANSAIVTAAFGVPSGNKIALYSLPTGGSPLSEVTAPPYTFTLTPGVEESAYYLEAALGDCVSPRSPFTLRKVTLAPPSAPDLSRVDAGSVTFTAQPGDPRGTVIRLYNANNQLIAEKTQPEYELTTPFLSAGALFYLRSYDPILNCESEPTAVRATIIARPPLPIIPTDHLRCGPGAVTLSPSVAVSAPENYEIRLYSAALGSAPIGAYTHPFTITLNDLQTNACYFLETYEIATGITSAARAQTCITILPIPESPVLANAVERCGPGAVTFSFNPQPGAERLLLYSQAAGGSALREVSAPFVIANWNITTTSTFYASSRFGQCESSRIPVVATVLPFPTAPSPSSFERCSVGEQTINLGGLAHGLGWRIYVTQASASPLRQAETAEATFTFAFNQSTILWAAAYDLATSCESVRSQLSINLLPPPSPPVASDVSFCTQASQNIVLFSGANQRIELRETPGGSVLRSYTEGSCVQGCTFTTPVLSQSITYYLEAIDSRTGCRSTVKEVKVISQMPAPPRVEPIAICAQGGFVTFSYSIEQTGANQIRLYRSVGNMLITTANQMEGLLRGPYITVSSAFLISSYNTQTQCESPRALYTVPVRAPLPLPIAQSVGRCPGQSATLSLTIPQELSGVRLEVYATRTAGVPIFTTTKPEDMFLLPPSSVNDTVYLVYRDLASGCASGQQPLAVVITPPPPAPNNQTVIACGEQLVVIRALPSGVPAPEFAEYRLYSQAAGIEPMLVSTVPPYDISLRTAQNATYYFAGRDLQTGCESQRAVIRLQRNNPPAPPVVLQSPVLLCRPGSATISAAFSGPAAHGMRLYTTPEGGNIVAFRTEAPYHFVLPSVTVTTTFYLESWNNGFICSTSQRAPAIVQIDPGLEPESPSVGGPVSFCAGAAAQFTALPGDNSTRAIMLYTSASGGEEAQIIREAPFVFSLEQIRSDSVVYLEASNATCSSRRRTPVLLMSFAKPPAPEVERVERCGPGRVTFTITNLQAGITAEFWNAQNTVLAAPLGNGLFEVPYLSNSASFGVRFNNNGCFGELTQVDAFIKNCTPPPCAAPAKPSLESVTADNAIIVWMHTEGASRYRVTYRETGSVAQQSVTTANNRIALEGLFSGRTYEVSIQAECIQDDILALSAPAMLSFETAQERKNQTLANEPAFKLYPNPSQGRFFLEAIGVSEQALQLSLWDMLGNLVWSGSWTSSQAEPVLGLDWSHLAPALYRLSVSSETGSRAYPVLITR